MRQEQSVKAKSWKPFRTLPPGERAPAPRPLSAAEGVGDRLRSAAFAELMAREAFLWAAERFSDAPEPLRDAWRRLAAEEDRHLAWLLARLAELGRAPDERPVSTRLWEALSRCGTAEEFETLIAGAEERGRQAGLSVARKLAESDPATAAVFGRIAEEEVSHVELAAGFFPGARA